MSDTKQKSIAAIIADHRSPLKNFIRKRVATAEDTEDILQEVFYQLARADAMMNPINQVTAWLYRVARNLIINNGKKKREEELPIYRNKEEDEEVLGDLSEILFGNDDTASPSPETEYLRSLVWTELEKALAELPPEQRSVFEQTELEGLSVKEIAQTTGIAVNTLLSRKHYAVLHLRKRLEGLYEEIIYM